MYLVEQQEEREQDRKTHIYSFTSAIQREAARSRNTHRQTDRHTALIR